MLSQRHANRQAAGTRQAVAWACASLAFSADGLTAALCAAAADRQFVRALTLRQVGRLAWALAAFDARDDPALEALLGSAVPAVVLLVPGVIVVYFKRSFAVHSLLSHPYVLCPVQEIFNSGVVSGGRPE